MQGIGARVFTFKGKKKIEAFISGLWSSIAVWRMGGKFVAQIPDSTSNVVIPEGVAITLNQNPTINSLIALGVINFGGTARMLIINNSFFASNIDLSGAAHSLNLLGVSNNIINFTSGTSSTVVYARAGNQAILNLSYFNLTLSGGGIKQSIADILIVNSTLQLNSVSLNSIGISSNSIQALTGTNIINASEDITCNQLGGFQGTSFTINLGTKNLILNGSNNINGAGNGHITTINAAFVIINNNATFYNASSRGTYNLNSAVLIKSNFKWSIRLWSIVFNGVCNGENSISTFEMVQDAFITITTATFMSTGRFEIATTTNTSVIYNSSSPQSIRTPDLGQYDTLQLNNLGVKQLQSNLTVNTLYWLAPTTATTIPLDLNSYTLTVTTLVVDSSNNATVPPQSFINYPNLSLFANGVTAVTLTSNITVTNLTITGNLGINFNGFTITVTGDLIYNSATNQNIHSSSNIIHTGRLIIRGTGARTLLGSRTFTDLLIDNSDPTINFGAFTLTPTGTTSYINNGSQRIWGSANIIYNNLTLGGTSTPNNKVLQGNVTLPTGAVYTVAGNAVRVDNGFTFTQL